MDGSTRLHTTGRWHASALCSSEADSGPHSSKELAFFFEALGDHLLQGLRRSMPNDDMHSAIGGRAGPGTCRLRSAPSAIQTWTHGGYGSVLSFLGSGIALLRKRRYLYGSPSTPPLLVSFYVGSRVDRSPSVVYLIKGATDRQLLSLSLRSSPLGFFSTAETGDNCIVPVRPVGRTYRSSVSARVRYLNKRVRYTHTLGNAGDVVIHTQLRNQSINIPGHTAAPS